jgi:nitroreductase
VRDNRDLIIQLQPNKALPGMEFSDVVKKRWMCRQYLDKDVPEETIEKILDVASHFPSAGHTQPQELIVIRGQEVKEALGEAALGQMFIAEAPLVIVVVSDTRRSAAQYGSRGVHFYAIIDGAFAAMLLLLAAVNEGLGTVFVAAFDDQRVQKVLGLPKEVRPIGILPIGYCAERAQKLSRRSRQAIIHYEKR